MKVVLADKVAPECARLLTEAGLEVDDRSADDADAKLATLADAVGLVVRSATQVTAAMMDAAPQLKVCTSGRARQ